MSQQINTKCGYIAIIGRPNVGKSTLLNKIIGQKISITSRKPQTTRHRILGIHSEGDTQLIFVDTPGIHTSNKSALNRYMNKAATSAVHDVDVIVFMVDGLIWNELDELALKTIKNVELPTILVINKVDKIKEKNLLLPHMQALAVLHDFTAIIPLSAKSGKGLNNLIQELAVKMPNGPFLFDQEQITDRPLKFTVAELIREKIFRLCGQELPYSVTVEIEEFNLKNDVYHISALILVEKENHKSIIIGDKGARLKEIGTQARIEMERVLEHKVFLRTWLKVKTGWSDDARALRSLGYDDF